MSLFISDEQINYLLMAKSEANNRSGASDQSRYLAMNNCIIINR